MIKQSLQNHYHRFLSGGSPDAVLYTEQTLTDAQKKQARENIGAAVADFVINGTRAGDGTLTLDKTFAQIQAAIQEGKQPVAKIATGGSTAILPFVGNTERFVSFMAGSYIDESYIELSYLAIQRTGKVSLVLQNALPISSSGVIRQVYMESDPVDDMQIATKKYVDDALDGKAGTTVATASANGLMSKDDKAKLDGITGQVTAANIHAPEHTTDLVQYGAFQIAAQQIISQIPTVPDVLPNPKALVIKIGSTTVTYDGSAAKTVEIADGSEVSY